MHERIAAKLSKLIRKLESRLYHTRRVRGTVVRIPFLRGLRSDPSEPWMLDLLEVVLSEKEGTFVDVGVNLGQTLIKVRALDTRRRYVGFEPNPACVFYVDELIRLNRYRNCTIVPVGLHTEASVLELNLFSASMADSAASLVPDFRPGERVYEVRYAPVFPFQSVVRLLQIDPVAVIKIDVEGAELEVLKSLRREIARDRPVILLEVLPVYSVQNVPRLKRQQELEQIFESLDYVIYRVHKAGDQYRELIEVATFGVHSDLSWCDYVAAPRECAGRVCRRGSATRGTQRTDPALATS